MLKNLQNKKFWVKLHRTMLQWTFITQSIIFILYLLLHMKMKKLLVGAFLWMFAVAWVAVLPNNVLATDGGGTTPSTTSGGWSNPDKSKNLIGSNQSLAWDRLLTTIKNAVNWLMWILATIALVICLYGWFKMVTAAGDEKKYQDGLKVLKYAALWLAVIWIAWMVVSIIFWFINTLWWTGATDSGSIEGPGSDGSSGF